MTINKMLDLFHSFTTVEQCLAAGRTYILDYPEVALENLKFGYAKGGYFSYGGLNEKCWDKAIKILIKENEA